MNFSTFFDELDIGVKKKIILGFLIFFFLICFAGVISNVFHYYHYNQDKYSIKAEIRVMNNYSNVLNQNLFVDESATSSPKLNSQIAQITQQAENIIPYNKSSFNNILAQGKEFSTLTLNQKETFLTDVTNNIGVLQEDIGNLSATNLLGDIGLVVGFIGMFVSIIIGLRKGM